MLSNLVHCSIDLKTKLSIMELDTIVRRVRQQVEFWPENGYYDCSSSTLCRFMMPYSPVRQVQAP